MTERRLHTPKQALLAHITAMHKHSPRRGTFDQYAKWHAHQHHHFSPNHYHEGVNLGPDDRPPGWRSGEGAVPK